MMTKFRDRTEAGRQLARQLTHYANRDDVWVIALPRGGVPVAFEVAKALKVPWDICLVRKLGVPGHRELAMGAIAKGGVRVLNYEVVSWLGISRRTIDRVTARELRELQRQDRVYRGDRPPPNIRDHTILLIDDGVATGSIIRAAIAVLREQQPKHIVVAVPVAAPDIYRELKVEVNEIACVITPEPFYSISVWYKNFSQTTDEEVHSLLEISAAPNNQKSVI